MQNFKKITRQQIFSVFVLLAFSVLGAIFGWLNISAFINTTLRSNEQKTPGAEPPFVFQSAPLENTEVREISSVADSTELRIWEMAARQALPPRKESLTPPRWRVVGVITVGNEQNVLLLFGNQPATEIRKTGDKLPGGAKILQISQDHLQISLNGQLMKLNLRKQ